MKLSYVAIGMGIGALLIGLLDFGLDYLNRPPATLTTLVADEQADEVEIRPTPKIEWWGPPEEHFIKWAGVTTELSLPTDDGPAPQTISFTEKDGVLDVQIEGYKDMTEAAREFIRILKEEWGKE